MSENFVAASQTVSTNSMQHLAFMAQQGAPLENAVPTMQIGGAALKQQPLGASPSKYRSCKSSSTSASLSTSGSFANEQSGPAFKHYIFKPQPSTATAVNTTPMNATPINTMMTQSKNAHFSEMFAVPNATTQTIATCRCSIGAPSHRAKQYARTRRRS